MRKVWHIGGGLVAIALAYYIHWPYTFSIALAVFLTWVTVESLRRREPWFGKLFMTISAPFVRGYERRKYVGNTWFALSVTILSAIFHDPILLAGSVVGWTFGDPAAEIIGRLIPSKKYFGGEKSLSGTLSCFIVSFFAFFAFFTVTKTGGDVVSASLTGAAATTLAETFSLSFAVNDNFTIPLVTALSLSFVLY
jgi:dolichol kinase